MPRDAPKTIMIFINLIIIQNTVRHIHPLDYTIFSAFIVNISTPTRLIAVLIL